jgi:hypothetical protein
MKRRSRVRRDRSEQTVLRRQDWGIYWQSRSTTRFWPPIAEHQKVPSQPPELTGYRGRQQKKRPRQPEPTVSTMEFHLLLLPRNHRRQRPTRSASEGPHGGTSKFPAASAAAVPAAISSRTRQHRKTLLRGQLIFSCRKAVANRFDDHGSVRALLINRVAASREARRHRAMVGSALALL